MSSTITIDTNIILSSMQKILRMFKAIGQAPFPRNIMTWSYSGFFPVYTEQQMFQAFEHAKFRDCRISAYPPIKDDIMYIPNMLLLDMDLDHNLVIEYNKDHARLALKRKVNSLLRVMQIKYHITNFMVLWTGNGYHIMIPFHFDRPFEHLKEFGKYSQILSFNTTISEAFLPFAKKHLSNGKADTANIPNFHSMFFRVPGTINRKTKYGSHEVVNIEHAWDYTNRGMIPTFIGLHSNTDLIYEFISYLDDKTLQHRIEMDRRKQYTNDDGILRYYTYVKRLLEEPERIGMWDYRKNALSLIIIPYLIVVLNMEYDDQVIAIAKKWLDGCGRVRPLDEKHNWDIRIETSIAVSREKLVRPMALSTLKENCEWLYRRLVN